MANATKPQVGRSVGHEWAFSPATSGHFYWPPTGSSDWPLTPNLYPLNPLTRHGQGVQSLLACSLNERNRGLKTDTRHPSERRIRRLSGRQLPPSFARRNVRMVRRRWVDGEFVVAGGDAPPLLEDVKGAFDDVAAFVDLLVEAGLSAALAAVSTRPTTGSQVFNAACMNQPASLSYQVPQLVAPQLVGAVKLGA